MRWYRCWEAASPGAVPPHLSDAGRPPSLAPCLPTCQLALQWAALKEAKPIAASERCNGLHSSEAKPIAALDHKTSQCHRHSTFPSNGYAANKARSSPASASIRLLIALGNVICVNSATASLT